MKTEQLRKLIFLNKKDRPFSAITSDRKLGRINNKVQLATTSVNNNIN